MSAQEVTKSVEETARYLATEHAAHDEFLQAVYWSPDDEEVLLVEVTAALTDDEPEILPFRYAPDLPAVPYPSVVVLLSPAGWQQVADDDAAWPHRFVARQRIWSREDAA